MPEGMRRGTRRVAQHPGLPAGGHRPQPTAPRATSKEITTKCASARSARPMSPQTSLPNIRNYVAPLRVHRPPQSRASSRAARGRRSWDGGLCSGLRAGRTRSPPRENLKERTDPHRRGPRRATARGPAACNGYGRAQPNPRTSATTRAVIHNDRTPTSCRRIGRSTGALDLLFNQRNRASYLEGRRKSTPESCLTGLEIMALRHCQTCRAIKDRKRLERARGRDLDDRDRQRGNSTAASARKVLGGRHITPTTLTRSARGECAVSILLGIATYDVARK